MTIITKGDERRLKRLSNFALEENYSTSPPHYKDYEMSEPVSPTIIKNQSLPLEFVNKSAKRSPKKQ